MIRCPYCEHEMMESESGLPEECPECYAAVSASEWEHLPDE
jgi:hypothetical protein